MIGLKKLILTKLTCSNSHKVIKDFYEMHRNGNKNTLIKNVLLQFTQLILYNPMKFEGLLEI